MRVCDRDRKTGDVIFKNLVDDSEYDLCRSCHEEFMEWFGKGKLESKPIPEPVEEQPERKKILGLF